MSGRRAKQQRRTVKRAAPTRVSWKDRVTAAGLVTGALIPFVPTFTFALPQGGTVAAGTATITTPTATSMQIEQATDRLIMDWTRFNIAANESVRFQQPSAASIALNRVSGQEPSAIYGSLSANGQIFLLNPSGILFGSSSRVDVAALTASTLTMTNQDFLNSQYRFTQNPSAGNAAVVNQGLITAGPGGYVALLGAAARNEGVIQARLGSIALAAGTAATLDMRGDGLIQFVIADAVSGSVHSPDGTPLASAVSNTGTLQADGGMVILQAKAAAGVVRSVVNQEGIIRATSLVNHGGVIKLIAGDDVANTGEIGWQANLGKVKNGTGAVTNYGILDVSAGEAGAAQGQVTLAGEYVGLAGTILARGADQATGGRVLLTSSKETVITKAGSIDTSGSRNSSAGNVVVWSDSDTIDQGRITARGGTSGGDGGNAEVSGYQNLNFRGTADLSAPQGHTGSLLLDPTTITITGGSGDGAADGTATFQGAAMPGTIAFTDATPTTVYESEIEGLNADIVLQAKQTITTSGTFGGAQVLVQNNRNLTLQTRNQVGDGAGGIDLTASADGANLEFKTQGTGAISITGSTDGGAAGNVTLGKLTTQGGAIAVTSNNGVITMRNNLTTAGGAIALLGATSLGGDVTLDTTNAGGSASGANITVSGQLDGAHALTLEGGTAGAVTVRAASRSFDGVGNYVLVNSTFGLGTGDATVGAWVNLDSASRSGAFVKIGSETDASGGDGYAIGVGGTTFDDTGNHLIILYEGVRWINTNVNIGTGWHHVAVTLNNAGSPTVYLDGTAVYADASGAPRAPGSVAGANDTQIGGYTGSGSENRHAQAVIADVQIYNRALSGSEIIQIKSAPASVTSGEVGFWPLMGGATEADRSGQGNTGTLVGSTMSSANPSTAILTAGYGTALTSVTATGNAIAMNGVTTTGAQSYISSGSVTLDGALTTTSNGSISVTAPGTITVANAITANGTGTVTLTATGGSSDITTSAAIDSGSGMIALLADNNITLNSGGTVGASTTGAITIAADNDGSGAGTLTTSAAIGNASASGAMTLSGNDIALGASVTGSGALTLKPSTAGRNITIGADSTSDFALNPYEVGLLTDGFSSITIGRTTDGTGTATIYPVTFTDPLSIAAGSLAFTRPASSSFDGIDDYISLATAASLNISGDITMSAWVKTSASSEYVIGGHGPNPYPGYGFGIGLGTPLGTISEYSSGTPAWTGSNTAVTDGTWHNIAVSVTAGVATFYRDGVADGTGLQASPNSYSGVRALGARQDGLGGFTGQMQYVHIYNRALSAMEVAQIRLYPGSVRNGLQLYTPLGEAATASDYSGNVNTGTLQNGVTTNASAANVAILNTGTDTLTLTARTGSIQGSGAGTDINAGSLTASAVTGIGSTTQLTTQTTTLSATTSGAGAAAINIANSNSAATIASSFTTVGANAPITFAQNGGGALTVASATTTDGAVTLSNVGADLTATSLAASGANSNINLTTTTSGNISIGSITGAVESLTVTTPDTASLPAVTTRDGGISVTANAITLNGNLSTNAIAMAGPVVLTGALTLGTDVAITTDAATTDANITLSGQIDGAHAMILNAGSGNIIVQAASRSFNGVNGYISVANAPALSSSNVKTVSMWVKKKFSRHLHTSSY